MTDRFSNSLEMNQRPESNKADKGDYILVGIILVLLSGVGGYLVLNPAQSTLRTAVAVEEADIRPDTAPVVLEPIVREPAVAVRVDSGGITAEPDITNPTMPEVATLEEDPPAQSTTESVAIETDMMPEVDRPETVSAPAAPEPAIPEPVALEAVTLAAVAAKPVTPAAPAIDTVAKKAVLSGDNKSTLVWAVNLTSLSTQAAAQTIVDQLKSSGTETEFVQVQSGGHTYYRVRIHDLASKQAAEKAKAAFKNHPDYKDSWINSYPK